jgi:hypothetical protein
MDNDYNNIRLYDGITDCLIHYVHPRYDKHLIEGRALALMASGKLALVPAHVQKGDVVFTSITSTSYIYVTFLLRPNSEIRNSSLYSVANEEIISALKDTKDGPWHWGQGLKEQGLSELSSDDDSIFHCTLVGDCLIEAMELEGRHLPESKIFAIQ